MNKKIVLMGMVCLFVTALQTMVFGQNLSIRGLVRDGSTHVPLPGVNVVIKGTDIGVATSVNGLFELKNLKPQKYTLVFTYVGYKSLDKVLDLSAGKNKYVKIDLISSTIEMNGIEVTTLRPDMQGISRMKGQGVREVNPTDAGSLLRNLSGVDAVRRGPVGLDPVVRGLRGSEVGVYLDGSRIFPVCPGRMDPPLSHLDPSNITDIKVMKGPYALTWGAGNMSAIWVETKPLTDLTENSVRLHLTSGFQSNSNEISEIAGIMGKKSGIGYQFNSTLRQGQDYKAGGSGEVVPAHFLSREIRGKVGIPIQSKSMITASVGFQNQEHIDYPGRMLNADHFDVLNTGLTYEYEPMGSILQSITAKVYANHISHLMDNNGKPTALPDPNRTPPFAIDVNVPAYSTVVGWRLNSKILLDNAWNIKVGGDGFTTYKKAIRSIRRKDNGMLMFTDLMWPDAILTDVGLFIRVKRNIGDRLEMTGAIRYDYAYANADTVSPFFLQNITDKLKSTNDMLDVSVTANYIINSAWSVGLGYGSVARSPNIAERYSDRIPSSKAQMSAEFVGNPYLKNERNNQADLYIQADYNKLSWRFDGFVRSMINFITIQPTNLPKLLPSAPPVVYQYINGQAIFRGFESSLTLQPIQPLQLSGRVEYLWGANRSLNEPVLGISPFQLDTDLRYAFQNLPLYIDGMIHFVRRQNRIASILGETSTNGHVTANIRSGFKIWKKVLIEMGVTNLTNTYYVNHLNAKNPFTGLQVPEPGRVFYINISLSL